MSSTELDLPLLPSADQIRRREFATIRRGYDPEQVREYLLMISRQVEILERELREARLHAAASPEVVSVPEPAEDPYERLAKRIADVLRSSDEQAERILEDARAEAALTVSEARSEADRIRVDAQSRAEEARHAGGEVLKNAEAEAERVLSTLSARRETLVEQLQLMQSKLIGAAQELETAIAGDDDVFDEQDLDDSSDETASDAATLIDEPLFEEDESEGTTEAVGDADLIDPRYEDLWVERDTVALDLGDVTLDIEDDPAEE
ncbi:MAG TPA: DivIVA domain-containing protein [Actinomycetota bacterium]|jgi:DivIVA domain-containing protein|nr:DivIVA domain-containing protein [Actinomycetota bacterium]